MTTLYFNASSLFVASSTTISPLASPSAFNIALMCTSLLFSDYTSPKSTSKMSWRLATPRSILARLIFTRLSAKSTLPSDNAYRANESLPSKVSFLAPSPPSEKVSPLANPVFDVSIVTRPSSLSSFFYTSCSSNEKNSFSIVDSAPWVAASKVAMIGLFERLTAMLLLPYLLSNVFIGADLPNLT